MEHYNEQPTDLAAHKAHADIKIALSAKHYGEAESLLRDALKAFPDDKLLKRDMRNLLINTEQFDKAVTLCNSELAIDPENGDALYSKTQALQKLKKFDEARKTGEQLLDVQRDRFSYTLVANIAHMQHDYKSAIALTDVVLDNEPSNGAAIAIQGKAIKSIAFSLLKDKKPDELLALLAPRLEKRPNDDNLLTAYAMAKCTLKEHAESQEITEKLLLKHPDYDDLYRMKMKNHLGLRQFSRARSMAETILEELPKDNLALSVLSDAFTETGNYKLALEVVEKRIEIDPASEYLNGTKAKLLVREKRYKEASEIISTKLKDVSNQTFVNGLKANIAMHEGTYETAKELLNGLIAQQPESVPFVSMSIQNELVNGDVTKAAQMAHSISEEMQKNPKMNADVLSLLANGENTEALKHLFKKTETGKDFSLLEIGKLMADADILEKEYVRTMKRDYANQGMLSELQLSHLQQPRTKEEALAMIANPTIDFAHSHNEEEHGKNGSSHANRIDKRRDNKRHGNGGWGK